MQKEDVDFGVDMLLIDDVRKYVSQRSDTQNQCPKLERMTTCSDEP